MSCPVCFAPRVMPLSRVYSTILYINTQLFRACLIFVIALAILTSVTSSISRRTVFQPGTPTGLTRLTPSWVFYNVSNIDEPNPIVQRVQEPYSTSTA